MPPVIGVTGAVTISLRYFHDTEDAENRNAPAVLKIPTQLYRPDGPPAAVAVIIAPAANDAPFRDKVGPVGVSV